MIDALLIMSTATLISASKVCWGLYKGLVVHSGPWFNTDTLYKIVLNSESYFIRKYPHHVAVEGWRKDREEWLEDHIKNTDWDWLPLGAGRYLFGFKNQEDAILFKTTWY